MPSCLVLNALGFPPGGPCPLPILHRLQLSMYEQSAPVTEGPPPICWKLTDSHRRHKEWDIDVSSILAWQNCPRNNGSICKCCNLQFRNIWGSQLDFAMSFHKTKLVSFGLFELSLRPSFDVCHCSVWRLCWNLVACDYSFSSSCISRESFCLENEASRKLRYWLHTLLRPTSQNCNDSENPRAAEAAFTMFWRHNVFNAKQCVTKLLVARIGSLRL